MKPGERQGRLNEPEDWVDLYGDQLYRYAYARVRNQMVAEDLVQDTFLAALDGRDGFAGRSSEKTWLIAILKHKIIDHFRKTAKQQIGQAQDLNRENDYFFDKKGNW